jgi:hypothetical protein
MLGVTRMLGKYASGFRSFCAPMPAHSKIGTNGRNGSVLDRREQASSSNALVVNVLSGVDVVFRNGFEPETLSCPTE